MKLPNRPLTRVIALTTAVVAIGGAAAVAEDVQVTLAVVNGSRGLAVTGSNGTLPVGSPTLAFSGATVAAPFGVVVTDVLYERKDYDVNATLSNLYKLGTGGINCNAAIPSEAFTITFDALPDPTDLKAVVDTVLAFEDPAINDNLGGLGLLQAVIDGALPAPVPVTVDGIVGAVQELDLPALASLMTVADGAGGSFDEQAEHPECVDSESDLGPTSVHLQEGGTATLGAGVLDGLKGDVFAAADANTNGLTVAEAITAGLLPAGTNLPGGDVYEDAKTEVETILNGSVTLQPLLGDLDVITSRVVGDLVATIDDLVFSVIGQSGAYPNLPVLNLDTTKDGDPTTGTYHGVMTVTLTEP